MRLLASILITLCAASSFAQSPEAVVQATNAANSEVRSLSADSRLVVRRRVLTFTLEGQMFYQKDGYFRMVNHDAKTQEYMSDLGSNAQIFWIYAKRIDPNEVFYCRHAELGKSRLQPSLEPLTLMEALGVQEIDVSSSQTASTSSGIQVVQDQKDPRGFTIRRATTIDPTRNVIVRRSLYLAGSGKLLADVQVTDFYRWQDAYIPKAITINYPLETAVLTWSFKNVRVNPEIPADTWTMPKLSVRAVDLATGVQEKGLTY